MFFFYPSVPFEVPKLRSGKSALEAESESLDSYTADSDSTSRWGFPPTPPLSLRTMLSFHFLLSSRMQVSSTLNVPGLCPGGSLLRPQQECPFNTFADLALGTASWSELTSLGCCTVEDSATLL